MKDQYFGDWGDYGKYGMLRFLANHNISIAVNWYLTPNDESKDGKHINYLEDENNRRYDPELFDTLKKLVHENKRSVLAFEQTQLIQGARYYHKLLKNEGMTKNEKQENRQKWHQEALEACQGVELVFLDPDNGAIEQKPSKLKEAIKYCYADEIADYYEAGMDVVYYCSKGRRTYDEWENTKAMMKRKLPDAKIGIITFHKGTQRSYIFVIHKKNFRRYAELIKKFLDKWSRLFTEEFGKTGRWEGDKTGEKMTITNSQGVEMVIEECEDGWVNIKRSDRNSCSRISIDYFMSKLS